jgi:Mlc titration factor MtfA (ptsG expression regulator)
MLAAIITILLLSIAFVVYTSYRKKAPIFQPEMAAEKQILEQRVMFYQQLSDVEKRRFEASVISFLNKVRITGVETTVSDEDKVLIAAAATIPIFAFPGWEYQNIHEILLYPTSFNREYQIDGPGRDTLGMVGNGPLENVMLLSQQDLRKDFENHTGKSNTAIHEFVHLIDKADGDADGIPQALLPQKYTLPWLKRIHQEIQQIKTGQSDINPYGISNEAEFLAVAAEYFFTQPHRMEQKHPELYAMLRQIFTPTS